ncbi:major capsid protein [Streptomyces sp. NBC_00257]|uniref:major capsid protein n=1 Tax=unclassified Streptomyces TaxID=2593676 RepID=UPI002257BEF8|nr:MULTISPECIES: major capsid protein [unclassified Streptomyces]MCX5431866.1 major capsid protein [Streptomyces sp. NBC_00062]
MSFLDDLLAKLGEAPADQHADIVRQAITDAGTDFDPGAVQADVLARFDAATSGDTPTDDAAVAVLETLASIGEGVSEHQAAIEQRTARAAELGDRLNALRPPATEPEPVTETATVEPIAAPVDAAVPVAEPIAASARPRVPLGLNNAQAPAVGTDRESFQLIAAADVPGFSTGQQLSGLADFGQAWEQRMMPLISSGGGRDGGRQRVGVARIKRNTPAQFTIRNDNEAEEVIKRATDETQLPGGSLVAAGGWCAPSETLYDLCDMRITQEGMVKLPPVTARRGGVRYPADFDWAAIFGAWDTVGFHQTEAEAIDGKVKPCLEVPCPDDFIECRLDVDGVCMRTPILTERGWPERVAQFTEGVLAIHAHKLNAWKMAKMEALSTPITMPAPAAPNPQAAVSDPHGPGLIESVLSMLELQVQYQRYRERLSQNATLEMLAPYWLRGILKSDLRKKQAIERRWTVADGDIDGYLRSIGVSPQWVYDWQDAYADQDAAGFGGTTVPTVWPGEVKILLYRAGSFFQLQADVISLDGVYDHASLTQNMYTSLFTEEGIQVCMRCGVSYVVTIPLCANGLSGGLQTTTCAAPTP